MRLRLIALVLLVIAATAGAFVLARDSAADAWLLLASGVALAAVTGALAVTTQRRTRDIAERRRSESEQAALRRLATMVAQEVPQSEVRSAIAEEIGRLLGTEVIRMLRFDGDSSVVVMGSWGGEDALPLGSRERLEGDGVVSRVLQTGRTARIDNYTDVRGPLAETVRSIGLRAVVGAPILVEGRVWGAITTGSTSDEPLPPDTESRLLHFTELMATAIANAEARDALQRIADEQSALRRVATLVARDAPSGEVFEAVATEVGKLLDTDITVVGRYDGDGFATAIGSWSAFGAAIPVGTRSVVGGHNLLTIVAESGKPARVDGYDEASGEAAEIARQYDWRSSIAAPIAVEGRVWGVMLVARKRLDPFPEGAEERLAAFTDLVATAVGNAQAHDELRLFGDEQAALGRVATLVAAGAAPEQVFTAVVEEASKLLALERIELVRYGGDNTGTVIAASGEHPFPAGSAWALDDASVMATVARTNRTARIDDYSALEGEIARMARSAGFRSAVGAPMTVEGRLWGVIIAISTEPEPIPERSEARLCQFTDLVATAVANAEARQALERVADEQAALRRVATLVARGTEPVTVFHAVCSEAQALLGAEIAAILRFDLDQTVTVMATSGEARQHRVGTHLTFDPGFVIGCVHETQQAARFDTDDPAAADMPEVVRILGLRSAVGSPIVVDGELWGVITLASLDRSLPLGMERRLADFTALVATAIANAENKSELSASRRRIVAASDETRRQIERDLHDGTQQRLVSLGLAVRAAEANLPPERDDLRAELSGVAMGLVAAVEDLQEISRGIHPAILSKGGIGPALQALAHRSAIPVDLEVTTDVRPAEPIEVAAYFVASEALANAAKHSHASLIEVSLEQRDGSLVLSIRDDGVGGADAALGSGIVGLNDRVEALGGSLRVDSSSGEGTQVVARLPLDLELERLV